MKKAKIQIKQDEKNPVRTEILANSILDIARAAREVTQGKLTRNCLAALIKDKTGISKNVICTVLDAMDSLEKDWLK